MILLSKRKIDELRKEYESLKNSLLKENEEEALRGGPMDSYKEAAAFGVSKEAKAKRVDELGKILDIAKLLPEKIYGDTIIIGKKFTLKNQNEIKEYTLVDPVESDPSKNLISIDSPLGKSVMNKRAGTKITIAGRESIVINVE